ncbi:MAG: AmmeMemoRadiSam system radical SAM enzyme [Candidatus Marinimicrobia bacterium CG08_land_8_20_14_0_20_45_22]|nr:MAG: AmmeMemoRadiSam system radical SAM enzyme [Candidatus Marinimicrobia bacterium CG08_land_8_20_14_0_20_45_22]
MKEALLYQKLAGNQVRCDLCAHRCVINAGKKGLCRVRVNHNGTLYTEVYGRTITQHIDPIEKKPLYHFYPGSKAYSIATPGCNFHCKFCQNWDISQIVDEEILKAGQESTPEQIVLSARQSGCKNIAYTYSEPTIFFEYSYDTARLAHESGIKNVYVTNGYMTTEMLEMIGPYLDGVNIDLKAFRDETYRRIIGARLQPVLDSLKQTKKLGIWLEVTSLIISGINDDWEEIRDMANFVANELGRDVPWHISRFFPAYKMKNVPVTPKQTLFKAREIGLEAGLNYVYIGNLEDHDGLDTKCPKCGRVLIERSYFGVKKNYIQENRCPNCGLEISGMGL